MRLGKGLYSPNLTALAFSHILFSIQYASVSFFLQIYIMQFLKKKFRQMNEKFKRYF